jgi:hypothetical protein
VIKNKKEVMKTTERFDSVIMRHDLGRNEFEETKQQCVEISDEYAKEVLRTYINSKSLQYKQSQGDYSLDELLLIIKKEKGL